MKPKFAIETKELTKKYGDLVAVDRLNLNIDYSKIFGLLGPNGAGKTTVISMLCTIINPSSGSAAVNGFDIVKQPDKVRKSIGIVFQDPSLDDRLTGRENLKLHACLYDMPAHVARRRIEEVLKLVGLEERANSLVRTYSGGMKRRLELVRGLLHSPKVLFLDEPTLGLDPQTREYIWSYIEELIQRVEVTIILTTHYMEEAERLCHKVAIIDYGKIKVVDTPTNLKSELKGDVVSIATAEPKKLAAKLSELELASKPHLSDNTLQMTVLDGEKFVPRLVEIANEIEVTVDSVSVRRPTLNDVFLHYTGREMRVEGAESWVKAWMPRRR